jgi:hypothetical protein
MPAAEKASFDVRALQSQLMVVAITCEMQDDYNRFVTRFQPQLATAYRGVAAHFRRTGGRNGQRDLDQYITGLANGQSQVGIAQGQYFCGNQRAVFQQALAANSASDLAQITVQREIPNIINTTPCGATRPEPPPPGPPTPVPPPAPLRRGRRRRTVADFGVTPRKRRPSGRLFVAWFRRPPTKKGRPKGRPLPCQPVKAIRRLSAQDDLLFAGELVSAQRRSISTRRFCGSRTLSAVGHQRTAFAEGLHARSRCG